MTNQKGIIQLQHWKSPGSIFFDRTSGAYCTTVLPFYIKRLYCDITKYAAFLKTKGNARGKETTQLRQGRGINAMYADGRVAAREFYHQLLNIPEGTLFWKGI